MTYLENLRRQPRFKRQLTALTISALSTLLIFVVWLAFWPAGRPKIQAEERPKAISPFASLKLGWEQGVRGLKESLGLIQRGVDSSVSDFLIFKESYKPEQTD